MSPSRLNPTLAWMCKQKKLSTLVQAVFVLYKKEYVLLSMSDQK